MASRDFKNVQALERAVKILAFRLTGIDGATPVATPDTGIESVAQSPGDITITLEDKYSSLLSCQLTLGATDGAPAATAAAYESDTVSTTKTIVIDTAGSPDANDTIDVALFLKNSSVT